MRRTAFYVGLFLLALLPRADFIANANNMPIVWDADIYWNAAHAVKGGGSLTDTADLIIGREGVFPVLVGGALIVLPDKPETVYVLQALLDALLVLMIAHMLRRLEAGWWAAGVAGAAFALYVPAITGTGAFLQQVFLRFGLMLALWAYVIAFTTVARRWKRFFLALATVGVFFVAFGSLTTRPLLILIPATALMLTYPRRHDDLSFWAQSQAFGGLAVALAVIVLLASGSVTDKLARTLTGLSSSGTTEEVTTVLSMPDVWAPSAWETLNISETESLFGDVARDPVEFARRWTFSVFSQYRYPDMAWMQTTRWFTLTSQKRQHAALMIVGLLGLVALAGQGDRRRDVLVLVLVSGGYLTAIYAAISIEPRRLSAVMPVFALGVGFAWEAFAAAYKSRKYLWKVNREALAISLAFLVFVACFIGVLIQFAGEYDWPIFLYTLVIFAAFVGWSLWRGIPDTVFTALDVALIVITPMLWLIFFPLWIRLLVTALLLARMVTWWKRAGLLTFRAGSIAAGIGVLALFGIGAAQDTTWRETALGIGTSDGFHQTITEITTPDGLFPWLIFDFKDMEEIEINVDGQLFKAMGDPVFTWSTGIPARWSSYDTIIQISNTPTEIRDFAALPLPPDRLSDGSVTIDLWQRGGGGLDFLDYSVRADRWDGGDYIGPSLSPWYDGDSFWRWQWNANDPRIPTRQTLNGTYQAYNGAIPRLFVVYVPFGLPTNAFGAPQNPNAATLCGLDTLLVAPGERVALCRTAAGWVRYLVDSVTVGESPASVFLQDRPQNTRVHQVETDAGRVEVFQVLHHLYVANVYDPNGGLIYSAVFDPAAG